MLTARIIVWGTEAQAGVPYPLKDIPKSFPGRRWDKAKKCWFVPVDFVNQLADALRAAGCTVYVTRANGEPWGSGRGSHGHRSTPADGWADAMFEAVGPDRMDAVYKALSRTLHPDLAGGDTALMQELNTARQRRRRSAP